MSAPEEPRPSESGAPSTGEFQAHVRAARSEFEHQVAHARAEFEEANERIKQRTGRDLIVAVLISIALLAALLGSLIFFKQLFIVFALAACVLGTMELDRAFTSAGRRVDLVPQLVVGSILVLTSYFIEPWLHWVFAFVSVAVVIVWRLVAQMAERDGRTYGDVLSDVLIAALIQLYVPFFGSMCLMLLRQDGGEWWVLAFIIVAIAADTGAYVTGITLGRRPGARKMAPLISPKKTWDGFGGAVAAALGIGVVLAVYMLHLPWWTGLIFGAAVLTTATLGDLGESMIKRDVGIKDMSSWVPGHGGVLDRLDSILPSTTAALALYYLLTPLATT